MEKCRTNYSVGSVEQSDTDSDNRWVGFFLWAYIFADQREAVSFDFFIFDVRWDLCLL